MNLAEQNKIFIKGGIKMQIGFLVFILVVTLIIATVLRKMAENCMKQMVLTIEVAVGLLGVVFFCENIFSNFILAALCFFMFNSLSRLLDACVEATIQKNEMDRMQAEERRKHDSL